MMTEKAIYDVLKSHIDPYLGQDWVSAGAVRQVDLTNHLIQIELGYPIDCLHADLLQLLRAKLPAKFDIQLFWKVTAHAVQLGQAGIPTIKNIIAVGSGKGGVGKSTTALNLALALADEGARVGILDADIYGPNQPLMLGVEEKPQIMPNKKIEPIYKYGIQSMSIGYLLDAESPMIWRGPMISQAVQQMLNDTLWESLDYLFVDLPPGTGDIPLTLSKKVPMAGAVIVSTPQSVAVLDAKKALETFNKLSIFVLGVVENMSTHICSHCHHEEAIFGEGGGAGLAAQYHVPFLGSLPLESDVRQAADAGRPIILSEPHSPIAGRYRDIARRLAAQLSLRPVNYAVKFPSIVVE